MTDNQVKDMIELTEEFLKAMGSELITKEQLMDENFVLELSF